MVSLLRDYTAMMVASKHEDCFWFAPPFGTSFRWFQIVPLLSGYGYPILFGPAPWSGCICFSDFDSLGLVLSGQGLYLRVSLELAPNLQITETF